MAFLACLATVTFRLLGALAKTPFCAFFSIRADTELNGLTAQMASFCKLTRSFDKF